MIGWLFRNRRTGEITIAQMPNVPLLVFGAAWMLRTLLHPAGRLGTALVVAEIGGLIVWAGDEIIRGVNPWRRTLGTIVLVGLVAGWLTAG
jgi:hypothetical protein